ncbi:HU family DNA-binding protein [Paenibacillus sp. HB172176]|uniref:HU family DNA-binding protein n=1 Tax=Paenibacillus sp. HB172176 TaxID=2493690 RepID=UPI00143B97D4|nr:HU family DNA-binding protein [Paenibacillus sp. HB172176]
MNKVQLVEKYALKMHISKKNAEEHIDALFNIIIEGVDVDGIVDITKIIRIQKIPTPPRKARNPQTGADVYFPGGHKLKVTWLKYFKDIISK